MESGSDNRSRNRSAEGVSSGSKSYTCPSFDMVEQDRLLASFAAMASPHSKFDEKTREAAEAAYKLLSAETGREAVNSSSLNEGEEPAADPHEAPNRRTRRSSFLRLARQQVDA